MLEGQKQGPSPKFCSASMKHEDRRILRRPLSELIQEASSMFLGQIREVGKMIDEGWQVHLRRPTALPN